MRRRYAIALGVVVAGALVAAAVRAQEPRVPGVGDPAPDFKLTGTDGKEYTLRQFRGKKAVVLAWYPRALTSGCTLECNSLRDEATTLAGYDVEVFGISVDPVALNKQFAEKNGYNFVLLSDPDKTLARALGVLNPANGLAFRWTFVIDKQGIIRAIDKTVNPRTHGKDLVARLEELGIPRKK